MASTLDMMCFEPFSSATKLKPQLPPAPAKFPRSMYLFLTLLPLSLTSAFFLHSFLFLQHWHPLLLWHTSRTDTSSSSSPSPLSAYLWYPLEPAKDQKGSTQDFNHTHSYPNLYLHWFAYSFLHCWIHTSYLLKIRYLCRHLSLSTIPLFPILEVPFSVYL